MRKVILILVIIALLTSSFITTTYAATTVIDLKELFTHRTDVNTWDGTFRDPGYSSETIFGADSIQFNPTHIKCAAYIKKDFQNFKLAYKLKVKWPEDASDWGSIVTFRDQDPGVHVWEPGRGSCYGVFYKINPEIEDLTKAGEISITRWNQPVTQSPDPESLVPDTVKTGKVGEVPFYKGINLSDKEYIYNLIVEDVSTGVHFKLFMNGKKIIDFIDTKADRMIKKPGGLTILQNSPRTVLFSVVKPSEQPALIDTPIGSGTSSAASSKSTASSSIKSAVTSTPTVSTGNSVISSQIDSATESSMGSSSDSMVVSDESMNSAESNTANSDESSTSEPVNGKKSNSQIFIIIAVLLVILGGGAIAAYLIAKKKK